MSRLISRQRRGLTIRNRISRQDFEPLSAHEQLESNPYISPEELVQTMVNEDPELSLFAVSGSLVTSESS